MERSELEALIGRYIDTQVRGEQIKRRMREQLLGTAENPGFIGRWEEYGGDWNAAMREVGTSTAVKSDIPRFRDFIRWLRRHVAEEIHIDWPPVDVGNAFERYVYIMRALQTQPRDAVRFLCDKLWVSERTVENYLSALRYPDATAPNSFLGQSFVINGMTRADGTVRFLSSVHPILLMENLSCVVVMLQALLEKAESPLYREWAMMSASHVWHQLTDYAKGRAEDALLRAYPQGRPERARFEELKAMPFAGAFKTEAEVRGEAVGPLFYCWKAGERCRVACRDGAIYAGIPEPGSLERESVRLRLDDGTAVEIAFDDVLHSEACNAEAGLQ